MTIKHNITASDLVEQWECFKKRLEHDLESVVPDHQKVKAMIDEIIKDEHLVGRIKMRMELEDAKK